eukprot:6632969-Heterocapsa_arctica.AAC.1
MSCHAISDHAMSCHYIACIEAGTIHMQRDTSGKDRRMLFPSICWSSLTFLTCMQRVLGAVQGVVSG